MLQILLKFTSGCFIFVLINCKTVNSNFSTVYFFSLKLFFLCGVF
uniref:Uncharacterized protein n=1 Tax=Anguilla anguilla TaxID=7936 RepID=A0A0E9UHJ5_ANGAN